MKEMKTIINLVKETFFAKYKVSYVQAQEEMKDIMDICRVF